MAAEDHAYHAQHTAEYGKQGRALCPEVVVNDAEGHLADGQGRHAEGNHEGRRLGSVAAVAQMGRHALGHAADGGCREAYAEAYRAEACRLDQLLEGQAVLLGLFGRARCRRFVGAEGPCAVFLGRDLEQEIDRYEGRRKYDRRQYAVSAAPAYAVDKAMGLNTMPPMPVPMKAMPMAVPRFS